MNYSKNGFRVLGAPLVAVLGLIAFSATAAQAQSGWLVGGNFITNTEKVNAAIHQLPKTLVKHIVILGEPLGTKVEVLCEVLAVDDGLLFANEKAEGSATLLFTKCAIFIFEGGKFKEAKVCAPSEPIVGEVKFHAFLHLKSPNGETGDKKTYLLFEPAVAGGVFMRIKIPNPECAFSPELTVTGNVVAECLNESLEKNGSLNDYCLKDLVHHLIQEAPNQKTLFGDGLNLAGRPANLDGIVDVTQSEGKQWAVHI